MCWRCGAFRPYDMPPFPGVERKGRVSYVFDGIEYTAQDHFEKDPDEILKLIDAGCIVSLDDLEFGFGWEDLCKYPPLDSRYFSQKVAHEFTPLHAPD